MKDKSVKCHAMALQEEIVRRKAAEAALQKCRRHCSRLLGKLDRLREQLRQRSRKASISRHPDSLPGSLNKKMARLTSREIQVLRLIAQGRANKGTAAELGIGIKTVEKHRAHIMEKLGFHDTAGLTRCAIGAGIIESSA
jgi:DNA-binding NarL/FixJ family response regulator